MGSIFFFVDVGPKLAAAINADGIDKSVLDYINNPVKESMF